MGSEQQRGHGEKAARKLIEKALAVLGIANEDLKRMRKMDVRKAMVARLVRRSTHMGLEWIAQELYMGVRSGVSRADKVLQEKIQTDKTLKKTCRKVEMLQISS